jgi:pyridoxal phosphate enzyme (YggS family)
MSSEGSRKKIVEGLAASAKAPVRGTAARKPPAANVPVNIAIPEVPAAPKKSLLAERLLAVRERIVAAAAKAKREPADITLIAVTKYAAPEAIRELLALGVGDFGENKVQQLQQRAAQVGEFHARMMARPTAAGETMAPKVKWHMIGHLQRNKVKPLLPLVSVIHSIDSLRLAEEIDVVATKMGKRQPVLLQINASEEAQKSGVAVGAALHLAEQMATMPGLQLVGVMTMAAYDASEKVARHTFARTREVFEEIRWHKIGGSSFRHLSMGMTGDFEHAIAEGSTMVRIGTAIFGPKPENIGEDDEG